MKTSVIIVDDHDFFRLGVRTAIEIDHPDITIVGEAKWGADLFTLLETTTADLIILDIMLPDMNGVEIARRVKKEYPQIKILVISAETSVSNVKEMLEIGVEGFISKFENNIANFAEAIRSIMRGLEYYGKDISRIMSQIYLAKKKTTDVGAEFTEQERQIIEYCHKGLTGKQIAEKLSISYRTMEGHKGNIFRKLGIHSTIEMVHFAVRNGIIQIES